MTRIVTLVMAVVMAVAATACGSGNPFAGGGIVVGSADFTESELLMEMYAAALRKAGIEVQTRPRLGSRVITNVAVQEGSVTLMPEFSGNLLQSVDSNATATAADEVYAALQRSLPQGLEVLEQSEAEVSDVLVVTRQTAQNLQLTSMEQLGLHCGQLTLGAAGEWPVAGETRSLRSTGAPSARSSAPMWPVR